MLPRQIAESALNWVSAGGRFPPRRSADSVRVAVDGVAAVTLLVRGTSARPSPAQSVRRNPVLYHTVRAWLERD
jgi:hypothetical protein